MQRKTINTNPFNNLIGLLVMVLVVVGMFMLARFIFRILFWLSPILLIVALLLDYKVVLGYGKWLLNLVKRNPLMGIAAIVLTVLGFPLVTAFLAGKAFLKYNVKKAEKEQEEQVPGEYIDFEEVEEQPLELSELSEMKRREEQQKKQEQKETKNKEDDDRYDSLFD